LPYSIPSPYLFGIDVGEPDIILLNRVVPN
jgi:hypothetical protein